MTKAQPRRAAGTPSGGQWAASYHDEPDIDLKDHTKRRAVVAAAAVLPFALSAPSAAAQAPPGPPVWQSALGAIATARATKLGWLAPLTSGKVTYHIETAPKWTSPQWLAVPQAHGGVVVVADNRPFMPVQTTITGLQPGHTYIFQIVGVQDGSQFGSIGPISVAINPTSNSTWPQPSPCSTHPPMTPPALKCADQTYLAEIDQARRAEGLGPMALPTDYPHLPAPEQILVVTNSERGSRGLPTFAGLTARLNYYAEAGARAHEDPSDPTSAWASNWAGTSDPLEADFLWMYDDGPGGTNLDCTTPAAGGCWGHRQNILGDYGPHPEMGAAVYGTGSATQLFEPGPSAA
jgi:hypothetical protein